MANVENIRQSDSKYLSCIKIHGYRILPPLLNDEKRKEMLYYKELALQVEKRLKAKKFQKQSPNSSTDGDVYVDTDSLLTESDNSSSDKSLSEDPIYKRQVSLSGTHSDILNMLSENNKTVNSNHDYLVMPLLDSSAITKVPLNDRNSDKRLVNDYNLSFTIRSSSESTNENMNKADAVTPYLIIRQQSYTLENSDQVFSDEVLKKLVNVNGNKSSETSSTNNSESNSIAKEPITIDNKDEQVHVVANMYTDNDINQNKQVIHNSIEAANNVNEEPNKHTVNKPQSLVRSNSYILETPSPLLLAKMKEESVNKPDDTKSDDNSARKRKSWDLVNAKKKWSSIEHDLSANISVSSNKANKWPTFSSLPASPHGKMFLSSVDSTPRSHSKKAVFKVFKRKTSDNLLINNCQNITPIGNRFPKRILPNTPDVHRRVIKAFITPTRDVQTGSAEKEFAPAPVYSEPKPNKSKLSNTEKTDVIIGKARTIVKQRSLLYESPSENEHTLKFENACNAVDSLKQPLVLSSIRVPEQIQYIINKVQEEQSKQMSELIAKQKREQECLMKTFAEQQALLLSKLHDAYEDVLSPKLARNVSMKIEPKHETKSVINGRKPLEYGSSYMSDNELLKNTENLLLECKQLLNSTEYQNDSLESGRTSSQTIFCAALSSPEDLADDLNLTVKSNENDCFIRTSTTNTFTNVPSSSVQYQIVTSATCSQSYSEDSLEKSVANSPECNSHDLIAQANKNVMLPDQSKSVSNCSRQLFPSLKQIWAADKICAVARGYLVRRLMKTERVQNLIQTIKDTLICAMELHNEATDDIQAADVELHRRLLIQVTAACCNFHDIFFSLSKAEQMSVISMDRERQKEKLLRPVSARSSSSLSSATQRALERKMQKEGSDSTNNFTKKSNRSCLSARDFRSRAKSVELTVSDTTQSKRTSPQNYVMRRTMSYGANRKPWR